jgi:hypothetical protein
MSRIPTPPPTNVDATTATATTVNVSASTTSPGSTPAAVIGLKSIGATIPNVVAGNRGGSSAAQKAVNANNQKGLGRFSQLNPVVELRLRPVAQLVELRLRPAHSTCRA